MVRLVGSVMVWLACRQCLIMRHASFLGMWVERDFVKTLKNVGVAEENVIYDVDNLALIGDVVLFEAK